MSNNDFVYYILIPELATKFCMERDDTTDKQTSLKLYDNDLPTLHHNNLMDKNFILFCNFCNCCKWNSSIKKLIRKIEKISCVIAIRKVYI